MDAIYELFNFIVSVLSTIIEGIYGIISLITSFINLLISISRIIPNPLYACFVTFVTLYSTIFIFKIIRKG